MINFLLRIVAVAAEVAAVVMLYLAYFDDDTYRGYFEAVLADANMARIVPVAALSVLALGMFMFLFLRWDTQKVGRVMGLAVMAAISVFIFVVFDDDSGFYIIASVLNISASVLLFRCPKRRRALKAN
jgi:hypothetical protein